MTVLTGFYSQDMRTQLSQERESVRRITLQKDLEIREQQGKIEKAVSLVREMAKTLVLTFVTDPGTRQDSRIPRRSRDEQDAS